MPREVVDDDEGVAAAVAEILGDRHAGERGNPLQARRRRRGCDDENAALRRTVGPNGIDDPFDGRCLLSHRHIDADEIGMLLVDDRIDGERRLAGRAIADNQFALSASDGKERIHHEDSGLHRLGDEIPLDDGRG
jgi:hypothetical protein